MWKPSTQMLSICKKCHSFILPPNVHYLQYGWRGGSGLFFFWWTKNMLNLTGIGGPRHRHYFAWHYIISSVQFRHNPTCQRPHAPLPFPPPIWLASGTQCRTRVRRDICRCVLPMAPLPIPTHLLSQCQSHRICMQRCHHRHQHHPRTRQKGGGGGDIWLCRLH